MAEKPQHENAVVFVCDQSFLRFALFMIWQIAHHNPNRDFDFVIYAPDEITLPKWAVAWDVKVVRARALTEVPKNAVWNGTAITFFRFGMARELGHSYRRILHLDCDMFVEGGDFTRLFKMDLGKHPVGAVVDAKYLVDGNHHPHDYRLAKLPPAPYLNGGFQLIDTGAYQEQEIEKRAIAAYKTYAGAITTADQSVLNLVLRGKFAELSPAWNWQRNIGLPLVTLRFPVFVRHFIGAQKPDTDTSGKLEPRFNLAYREFFGRHDAEVLPRLAPPCDPRPMTLGEAAGLVWGHMRTRHLSQALLARHPDPYKARL